jgi:hypothetical protein
MAINSQHVTGFAVGIGVSAVGFYLYKRNQPKVDAFLGRYGIQLSTSTDRDPQSMTLKELIMAKEELEDMIAEKEFNQKEKKKGKSTAAKKSA